MGYFAKGEAQYGEIRFMQHTLVRIANAADGSSVFEEVTCDLSQHGGMWISEQQQAVHFRHRKSKAGYQSDWHVAGDPTLMMISQGTLRLELRDGSYKDFTAGEQFIAADYLPEGTEFDPSLHGHRARVIGEEDLIALHLKLEKR